MLNPLPLVELVRNDPTWAADTIVVLQKQVLVLQIHYAELEDNYYSLENDAASVEYSLTYDIRELKEENNRLRCKIQRIAPDDYDGEEVAD